MNLRDATLASLTLVLVFGCSTTKTEFGVDQGQPAVIWHPDEGSNSSVTSPAGAEKTQQLQDRVQDAERAANDDEALMASLYDLAVAKRRDGQLDEARQLYQRALAICEKKRGPNDPDTATILNNLAGVEAAQGDYDAARPLLERSLKIRQEKFGEENTLTAQSMSNLALLYAAAGDADAAEPLYRRSLAVLEKTDRPSKGNLDQVLENYAALLRDTGRDSEAEELEVRARVIRASSGRSTDASP